MSGWYLGLLWSLCVLVFCTDWLFRRVPNRLLLGVLAGYVVLRVADGWGLPVGHAIALSDSLVGSVLAFIFLLPFYAFRAMGAGDVKFFALLGLLLGPFGAAMVWLIGTALTGVHAILQWMFASHALTGLESATRMASAWVDKDGARLRCVANWIQDRRQGRRGIPYAAYMAVAAVSQWYWMDARL